MAKRLTVQQIEALPAKRARYGFGDNLYLDVTANGNKSWQFIWRDKTQRITLTTGARAGRAVGLIRTFGLGSFDAGVRYDLARELANDAAKKVRLGIDPIAERRQNIVAAVVSQITFEDVLKAVVARNLKTTWKVNKDRDTTTADTWEALIRNHVPTLLAMPARKVDDDVVVNVLLPVFEKSVDTYKRVSGVIFNVMSKAIADEKSGRPNPARYDDHLKERVGPRVVSKAKLAEKGLKKGKSNVNSLSYEKAPSIFQRLWNGKGMTTACMAFLMATGARSDEARCARWSEIDFANKVWFIDAVRMKASEDHAVPLCDELVDLLSKLKEVAAPDAEFIFPGAGGKALDPKAMDKKLCLTKHGGFGLRGEACMHGMRTTFTTWAQEQYVDGVRRWDDAAITMSIAHAHGTRADRAYMRSPQMQARREMLAAYMAYLQRPVNDNVIPMKRKEAA